MALSVTEQLKILNGVVRPPDIETTLTTLINQTAFVYAKTFQDGVKEFDEQNNLLAARYKDKLLDLVANVHQNNKNIMLSLEKQIVTILAQTTTTYNQVEIASQTTWEGFILNNIDEAFEYISEIRSEEKVAYDAI
jgi:replication fork clamp-binding protein CrfC